MSDALHDSPPHQRFGPRGSYAYLLAQHTALLAALEALEKEWRGSSSQIVRNCAEALAVTVRDHGTTPEPR